MGKYNLKIINKLQKISIEKALYIYISFNTVNLIIHLIGFITYPLFLQMDLGIYLLKIALMEYICVLLSKKKTLFSKQIKLFKGIIVFDVIELFISIFAYRYNQTYIIIATTFAIKAVLDFCIFTSLLFKGKNKAKDTFNWQLLEMIKKYIKKWICLNVVIPGVLAYIIFAEGKSIATVFLLILIFIRFPMQIFSVHFTWDNTFKNLVLQESEENASSPNFVNWIYKRFSDISTLSKVRYGIYGILFICFLFLRNSYVKGDQQLTDNNGKVITSQTTLDNLKDHKGSDRLDDNVYEYNASNYMPSWSIFYHKKYGLLNLNTGSNTGAKYDDYLYFDTTGIAYDYDRHFINCSGEDIIEVPFIVNANTSYRQELLNKLLDVIRDHGNFSLLYRPPAKGEFLETLDGTYFANGVAQYHTDYNDRFGIIKDDGTLVTLPKFSQGDNLYNFEISVVSDYNYRNLDVINSDGESILNEVPSSVKVYYYSRIVLIDHRYFYTFEGDLIGKAQIDPGYYIEEVDNTGSVLCFSIKEHFTDDEGKLLVFYKDSDPIFYSDVYSYCYTYPDDNGNITYLIAGKGSSVGYDCDEFELIDLDGNLLCPNTYYRIYRTCDHDTYIGMNEDESFDIIRSDGTVIETKYRLVKSNRDEAKILVSKMDDETQFNYIDLEGNLLQDWFTEDEE